MRPLVREFVLLPGLCREKAYDSPAHSDLAAGMLKALMSGSTFVRDLRDGEWSAAAARLAAHSNAKWRKLLMQWRKEGRALPFPIQLSLNCTDDAAWIREAEQSHQVQALSGVVGPPHYTEAHSDELPRLSIDGVADWPEWTMPTTSLLLERTSARWTELLRQLRRIDRRLLLVDRYLSPTKERYARLGKVLEDVARAAGGLDVEIHRWKKEVRGVGPGGGGAADVTSDEWRDRFHSRWGAGFRAAQVRAKVVLWQGERHDRYVLTKGLGLHFGNGFEVDVKKEATVTCLGPADRDRLYSECNPDAHLDSGVEQFRFGADS